MTVTNFSSKLNRGVKRIQEMNSLDANLKHFDLIFPFVADSRRGHYPLQLEYVQRIYLSIPTEYL